MNVKAQVRGTPNFQQNLREIRRFLEEADAIDSFFALVHELRNTVIPNLQSFPDMGANFLEREAGSGEGRARRQRLKERVGSRATLREYIGGEYIILYAVKGPVVRLLAIRHHRQLSYDFRDHWK